VQRAKLRHCVLVILAALAAASMFPSFGGGSGHHDAPRTHKQIAVAAKPHTNARASFGLQK
jgi:hypothetical protein